MGLCLRDYQHDIIAEVRSNMRAGTRANLVVSPTGSGKTVLTAHMLQTSAERGMSSWFNVHRRELVMQSVRSFFEVGVRHGVISAQFPADPRPLVQICSVQTLAKRFDKLKAPKLIIWDEAHHIAAGTWAKIFEAFENSYHIGLTATPERLDGKGLGDYFDAIVYGPTVGELIEMAYLSPYRLYAPTSLDLSKVHTRMGDYNKTELSALVDRPTITGDVVREYAKRCPNKRAVAFCVSIKHSMHVVDKFQAAGFRAAHVDGETPSPVRDRLMAMFASGEIEILSNVDLFGEGLDIPGIEAAILLRPTQSLSLFLQQCGRALRPIYAKGSDLSTSESRAEAIAKGPKPYAFILDHAGNFERHGLPCMDREWSLAGRAQREVSRETKKDAVRICPQCLGAQFKTDSPVCVYCGSAFEVQHRKVEEVEGELTEIDPNKVRYQKKKEQAKADSLEDLVELGRRRGYKRPHLWAKHVFNARQRKKLGRSLDV